MIEFLDGASCLACAAVAMFFMRFWRLSGDRLLLLFGLAFVVLAVNRIGLAVLDDDGEAGNVVVRSGIGPAGRRVVTQGVRYRGARLCGRVTSCAPPPLSAESSSAWQLLVAAELVEHRSALP